MSKICCVGEGGICPKSSSCSMVLRSACSHRHSRESSTVKENSHSPSSRKSKRNSKISEKESYNGTVTLESAIESSLRQLALKSAEKTYSLLKEKFYSFEFAEVADQKLFDANSLNLSCAKELQFSQLSESNNSSGYNHVDRKEYSSDYSSANESDLNSSESLISTSNMSKKNSSSVKRLTRSSVSSMRTLSGSEGEDDISVERIIRPRRNIVSDPNLSFNASNTQTIHERNRSHQFILNNHDSQFEMNHNTKNHFDKYLNNSGSGDSLSHGSESSHLSRSSVQYSLFDRFRWFLWRCTYLKIIRYVSFDVWALSRLHNFGKHKVIMFLLLPLLFFLLWGIYQDASSPYETVSQQLISAISSVYEFLSSLFVYLFSFMRKEEETVESETIDASSCSGVPEIITIFPSIASVFGKISGWLVRTGESAAMTMETKHRAEGYIHEEVEEKMKSFQPVRGEIQSYQLTREEMKVLASEILKDEISSLKAFFKETVTGLGTGKLKEVQRLENEIKKLHLEFQSLSGTMKKSDDDFLKEKERSDRVENVIAINSEYKDRIDHLNLKLKAIETKLGILEQLKNCCDKQLKPEDFIVLLEKHLVTAFKNIVDGDSDPDSKYYFFNKWLNSKFFSHEKLMQEINAALISHTMKSEDAVNYDKVIKVVETTVVSYVDSIKRNLSDEYKYSYSSFAGDIFSEDKIKKIVKEAIMLYDADKTGQVDYALESGGGSVLSTRCSETYVEKYGKISFFGVPLWTSSNSPRTAIQPDVQPGQCWAFKGSQGFLVLELSATIYPTGFTLEHIPVSLSPTGSIDSAPKNFSVWGLESEKDSKGKLLGEYLYDMHGEPLQYFTVQKPADQPYNYIELQIHSNHGNMEYTCLYRFRVHGRRFV